MKVCTILEVEVEREEQDKELELLLEWYGLYLFLDGKCELD